jgi:hypothetical protein
MLREPDAILWTVCSHPTYGRLNHPTVWNTHGSFLWLEKPNLERDEHGWFNIGGCVGDSHEIECTWLEWLRDAWSHSISAVILPSGLGLAPAPRQDFDAIMFDLRGWNKAQNLGENRANALRWLMRCDAILTKAKELAVPA